MPEQQKPDLSEAREIAFLTEQFDIPAIRAAELIAGQTDKAQDLAAAELHRQRAEDSLADVPTPRPAKDDFVADADEDRLKPVLHEENRRIGVG